MSSQEHEDAPAERRAGGEPAPRTRPIVSDLEASVATAVRTAIAGTLARHASAPVLPRIDMDFARDAAPVERRLGASRPAWIIAIALCTLLGAATTPVLWPHVKPLLSELSREIATRLGPSDPLPDPSPRPARRELKAASVDLPPVRRSPEPLTIAEPEPPVTVAKIATVPMPEPEPAIQPAPLPVEEAKRMLSGGDVLAARALLAKPAAEREIEAILALARSYDPNFLASLPRADAPPDAGAAERLYRDWFALSVEAGLISGEAQLDRLIKSLKR